MSDLQFDKENNFEFRSREILGSYKKPGLADWLQKKGIVKNDKSAQNLLVGITIFCFLLSFYFFSRLF